MDNLMAKQKDSEMAHLMVKQKVYPMEHPLENWKG